MLGDEVRVTTWRDGDAESNQATLHLRHRTNTKPILLDTPAEQRLSEFGTRVSVRLKNARASLLPKYHAGGVQKNFFSNAAPTEEMTLSQIIGILAPALDINVWCKDGIKEKTQAIEANGWKKLSPLELLKRLSPLHSEEELLRCEKSFCDIIENDGAIVGRASLAGSPHGGFGIDLGVLVYKGIAMGRWNKVGILLSSNNVDLARSLAQPICSEDALGLWAQAIYAQMKNNMTSGLSNILLSLGLASDELPVAEMADSPMTPEEIRVYLLQSGHEEIVLVMEPPDCPDSMSKADFEKQFELSGTVVDSYLARVGRETFGLEDWIGALLPETDNSPRSVGSAIRQGILKAWPGATWNAEERIVGQAGSEKIKAKCLVFRKAPSQITNDKN